MRTEENAENETCTSQCREWVCFHIFFWVFEAALSLWQLLGGGSVVATSWLVFISSSNLFRKKISFHTRGGVSWDGSSHVFFVDNDLFVNMRP